MKFNPDDNTFGCLAFLAKFEKLRFALIFCPPSMPLGSVTMVHLILMLQIIVRKGSSLLGNWVFCFCEGEIVLLFSSPIVVEFIEDSNYIK